MKYRIYYSASGLPKHEQPLSFRLIEHHLPCLTGDISRYFADQKISLQQSVVESGAHNVVVNLEASDPSLDVHTHQINLGSIPAYIHAGRF